MQCGPIRHTAARPVSSPHDLSVVPRMFSTPISVAESASIQDIFRGLAEDTARTSAIAAEAIRAYDQGRKVLVLTQRTEHVEALDAALKHNVPNLFTLHGRIPKKLRIALLHQLESLSEQAPRVLVATGTLIGEGFDHPPLDTLILAMPISWKGMLQQYAGRLHRTHADKSDVQVIDFVDEGNLAILRMWEKRKAGYRAMGYRLADSSGTMTLL